MNLLHALHLPCHRRITSKTAFSEEHSLHSVHFGYEDSNSQLKSSFSMFTQCFFCTDIFVSVECCKVPFAKGLCACALLLHVAENEVTELVHLFEIWLFV